MSEVQEDMRVYSSWNISFSWMGGRARCFGLRVDVVGGVRW